MPDVSLRDVQAALDFLNRLPTLPPSTKIPGKVDYGALSRMALERGIDVDPDALAQAFTLWMRARTIAAAAKQATVPRRS